MRQPNKQFIRLLLFLLLLGWAGPSLAAQAWTTAWTPGSASVKASSASSKGHLSKKWCYNCKRWDPGARSGQGGWVYYPSNSVPIPCDPHDLFHCKICDGKGNVIDKPNPCVGGTSWQYFPPIYDCYKPCHDESKMRTLGHCQNYCPGCDDTIEYVSSKHRETVCRAENEDPEGYTRNLENYIQLYCSKKWDLPDESSYTGGGLADLLVILLEMLVNKPCLCNAYNAVCGGLGSCETQNGATWKIGLKSPGCI